jgi:hypothetical protein
MGPAVALLGPRQRGKTSLARQLLVDAIVNAANAARLGFVLMAPFTTLLGPSEYRYER